MDKSLTLKASIIINAPVAEVWNALKDKEMIKKYFWGTETTCDWKKGSNLSFKGEWEGNTYEDKGTILEIEKEKKLKYNYWSSYWGDEPAGAERSIITYEVKENSKDQTLLTVKQEGFKDAASRDHSIENWQGVMANIKKLLEE